MNNLQDADTFIKLWDEGGRNITDKSFINKSLLQNINYRGDPLSDAAVTFTKNDENFYESIEPGIKLLVHVLVKDFNWITFSSCAGHLGYQGIPYKKRMVQLLPRNDIEAARISKILLYSACETNKILAFNNIQLILNVLEEDLTSGNKRHKSIKAVFNGRNATEEYYFKHIDYATEQFCSVLKKEEAKVKDDCKF